MTGKPYLFAPAGYWLLTEAGRAAICNGCGPKGLATAIKFND